MRKIPLIIIVAALSVSLPLQSFARKRPHVVVNKPPPYYVSTQPVFPPIVIATVIVPPLAVLYDLNRRVNCLTPPDPLGMKGPGFDGSPTPPTNVMVSCWERRYWASKQASK